MKKPLMNTIALGSAIALGVCSVAVSASQNPFAINELSSGYQLAQADGTEKDREGKCGEGKCGEDGAGMKDAEGKCGEGKCGEDKDADKTGEGKCGEGKCGEEKSGGDEAAH